MSQALSISSKSDRDRTRQQSSKRRRVDKQVADTARRIVREYLEHGRPAQACMADLVHSAKDPA